MDAGANVGGYTRLLARCVGPRGRVFAFEPDPESYLLLRSVLTLCRISNVHIEQAALGKDGNDAYLWRHRDPSGKLNLAWSSLSPSERWAVGPPVLATTVTLDEYFARRSIHRLDFIKLDIEGAEFAAMLGASKTIQRFRPVLLIELDEQHLIRFGTAAAQVTDWLSHLGYREATHLPTSPDGPNRWFLPQQI